MNSSTRKIIDLDSGLGRVRGNKSLYKRMLGLFIKSAEFKNFEDMIAAGDWAKSGEAAHTIKGMAGNLSLTAVFECSAELMTQLRQGPPSEDTLLRYRESLDETIRQLDGVIDSLE